MGPSAVSHAPAGSEVIDLAGAYLMPGLINMHVHLCGSGKPVSAGDAGALMKKLDNPVGRAIVRYIGKDNPTRATSFGQELRDKTKPLAQHPELGRKGRPGLPEWLREVVVHPN